jgi:microcystin-dependent protein
VALLAEPENWEQIGTQTPEDVAQSFLDGLFVTNEWQRCMPIGAILWFAHQNIPDYCLPCDGELYPRENYEALFDAIGYAFGDPLFSLITIRPESLLACWPLNESAGPTANDISGNERDGVITGCTMGQPGIGDGNTVAGFDASGDYVNIYSDSLRDAFNAPEGTISVWVKVLNAGVWTDKSYHTIALLGADFSNNYVLIRKHSNNNLLQWCYTAGGTAKCGTSSRDDIGWMNMAVTWNKAADQAKFYFNGVQAGPTLTGLGVWAGDLVSGYCVFGAETLTGTRGWKGYGGRVALWDVALTADEIASTYAMPYGFYVPDLRDMVMVGAGGDYALGASGGEKEHQLIVAEIPSHYHSQPSHSHTITPHTHVTTVGTVPILAAPGALPADGPSVPGTTGAGGTSPTDAAGDENTGSVGADSAHNNMPPYLALVPAIVAL